MIGSVILGLLRGVVVATLLLQAGGAPPVVGRTSPDFSLPDLAGHSRALIGQRGRPVALFFFCGCPWCDACAQEWARLQRQGSLPSGSSGRKPPITMIVFAGESEEARTFAEHNGLDLNQTLLLTDPQTAIATTLYKADPCPRVFVVDAHGVLKYTNDHLDDKPREAPALAILSHVVTCLRACYAESKPPPSPPKSADAERRGEADMIHRSCQYFAEAKTASDADEGKTWGRPLYGPMIFIDEETKTIYANQPDQVARLKPQDGVYIGKVGLQFPVANTSYRFGGVTWTVIPFGNMPSSRVERARLMMHESFHRIQSDLGLPPGQARNVHLDTKDGRIWLRLEWRALSVALVSWGEERSLAIRDALTFRAYRRTLFPDAAKEEDRMEMHEGLAEYTGIALDGLDNQGNRWLMAGRLKVNALRPSYPYSFAYETGPAYGLLLDMDVDGWRKHLSPSSSLSGLLAQATHYIAPENLQMRAEEWTNSYRPADVLASEDQRERERERAISEYRKLLVTGPVLELPLVRMNFTFDPNHVVPLGEEGNVYPTATISDAWGTVEAQNGARINATFTAACVAAPTSADHLSGDGWKLTLKPGWQIVPGEKSGSFKVVQK